MQTYRVASGSALAAYSPFKAESAPQNGDRFAPETALGRTIAPATCDAMSHVALSVQPRPVKHLSC